MSTVAGQFDNVSVICKANVYFDGGVISHSVLFKDGSKRTLGIIRPGSYAFNTDAPEKMEIVAGACLVKLPGHADWVTHHGGDAFHVAGKSRFEIKVESGLCEYICSFG